MNGRAGVKVVMSTVVMFILTFAILGLLLGFAEVYDSSSTGELVIPSEDVIAPGINATSSEDARDNGVATDD
jgi:hypothetical protein